jgi:hypothetical protein
LAGVAQDHWAADQGKHAERDARESVIMVCRGFGVRDLSPSFVLNQNYGFESGDKSPHSKICSQVAYPSSAAPHSMRKPFNRVVIGRRLANILDAVQFVRA